MRIAKRRPDALMVLFVQMVLSSAFPITTRAGERPFEVHDSIEISYFGTLLDASPDDLDDDGIVSPDGRYVVKVTHRGVLPKGATEGTIWLFDGAALRRSVNDKSASVPKPKPLVQVSAAVNGIEVSRDRGNTIEQLKWEDDSHAITFLGRQGQENRQLFRVNVVTSAVTALTPSTEDVVDYERSGNELVYLAAPARHEEQDWWSAGPGIPDISTGTGSSLISLLYPHYNGNACCKQMELAVWQIRGGKRMPVIDAKTSTALHISASYDAETLSLSPDGRHLATIAYQTARVIDAPLEARFEPTRAQQTRVRGGGSLQHAKHMIRFSYIKSTLSLIDAVPELILINSHDATSAYLRLIRICDPRCESA